MKLIFSAFLVMMCLLLVGCKPNRESLLAGNWTGSNGIALDLKEDKSYTLTIAGQPLTGKWSLNDSTVALTVETVAGKPAAEERKKAEASISKLPAQMQTMAKAGLKILDGINLTASEDNKSLTGELGIPNAPKLSFTKVEAAK